MNAAQSRLAALTRLQGRAGRCDQFAQAMSLKHERKRIQARSARAFAYANRPQRPALPVRRDLPISTWMRLKEKYYADNPDKYNNLALA